MPNIGPMELILLAVVAALIFGPAKLPEMARSLGRSTREFKDSIQGTGIQEAIDGVGDVRSAVKPSNLAKAAMPAPVKEMAAGVTEMKDTITDPLGTKKKEQEAAAAEAAADGPSAEPAPMPASREMPVSAAPVAAAEPADAPEPSADS
jgi:sec-independent protein translocase protein TatA